MMACAYNKNIDIIKYLIEEKKMNIHFKNDQINILFKACVHNSNLNVIKYLFEICDVSDLNFKNFRNVIKIKKIAKIIHNYQKLNDFLSVQFHTNVNLFEDVVSEINPMLLNEYLRNKINVDPYNLKWNVFIKNVDNIKFPIPILFNKMKIISHIQSIKLDDYDKELLFCHNDFKYYGSRKIVYGMIHLFEDIDMFDLNEPMVLSAPLPRYLIHMYIQSCVDLEFDLEMIYAEDLIQFLNFIDQYPTKMLSMESIEKSLVSYLNNNKIEIEIDSEILNLCRKYQLKHLYLYIHLLKKNLLQTSFE